MPQVNQFQMGQVIFDDYFTSLDKDGLPLICVSKESLIDSLNNSIFRIPWSQSMH